MTGTKPLPRLTILISSAGRRVALIKCFRRAAEALGIGLEVIAVDMNPDWSPACQVSDFYYPVAACTSPEFIDQVLEISKKHQVRLIIPTIDTELLIYDHHRDFFNNEGVGLHLSGSKFVRVARDKEATNRILGQNMVPIPQSWSIQEALQDASNLPFPLIVKPRAGSCSKDISTVASPKELLAKVGKCEDWVLQEVCTGLEYTVNCFFDRQGACVACVPHFRKFVRDGEVCFAQTERIPEFTLIAKKLSHIFKGLWGCICFQGFRQKDNSVRIFEINARFGGGYPICDQAGGTFARWILQDLMGETPDYHDNWKESMRMLRYDDAIFIQG
jgi:carbamoyl-phosphate synthase large subunit